jgi:hypothetical protein
MIGSGAGVRFVRINFEVEFGLGKVWHRDALSVMLAHELQHAVEIAEWTDVVDSATLSVAYARHGLVLAGERVDSNAARQAGEERRAELMRPKR